MRASPSMRRYYPSWITEMASTSLWKDFWQPVCWTSIYYLNTAYIKKKNNTAKQQIGDNEKQKEILNTWNKNIWKYTCPSFPCWYQSRYLAQKTHASIYKFTPFRFVSQPLMQLSHFQQLLHILWTRKTEYNSHYLIP